MENGLAGYALLPAIRDCVSRSVGGDGCRCHCFRSFSGLHEFHTLAKDPSGLFFFRAHVVIAVRRAQVQSAPAFPAGAKARGIFPRWTARGGESRYASPAPRSRSATINRQNTGTARQPARSAWFFASISLLKDLNSGYGNRRGPSHGAAAREKYVRRPRTKVDLRQCHSISGPLIRVS